MSADPRQTLYVSDLDGTLLRSDGSLSPYSVRTLNRLIGEGMPFTVASARGCGPIRNALGDLRLRLPVIATNGAYVSDLADRPAPRRARAAAGASRTICGRCSTDDGYSPFVFTTDGSADRFYYTAESLRNDGMRRFHWKREIRQDPRLRRLDDLRQGLDDQVVQFILIDSLPRIQDLEREVRRRHGDAVQIHTHEHYDAVWYHLTVQDARATKDQGVAALKRLLDLAGCRLVAFGDQSTTSACSAWPTKRTRWPAPLPSSPSTPPPSSAPTTTTLSHAGSHIGGTRIDDSRPSSDALCL